MSSFMQLLQVFSYTAHDSVLKYAKVTCQIKIMVVWSFNYQSNFITFLYKWSHNSGLPSSQHHNRDPKRNTRDQKII